MARKLEVVIVGDASQLEKSLGRATKSTSGFSDGLRKASYVAAGALAAVGIAAKIGFDELAEGQKVSAQTAAALKSTGGVANVTAKEIENLASSQSALTGIDDELIQASENLLLTFKNVRNEVGKGNDVFNRATVAGLDLATAGFGSPATAAKMLGKALNDPIKGMTALSRAGVTFSNAQKKAIKSLVETGDVLGAQKLILKEVESQVGGSAAAYGNTLPGQLAKARIAFEEMAANLVSALLPALTSFAAIVSKASKFLSEHETLARALVLGVIALASAVLAANVAMKAWTVIQAVATAATHAWSAAQWLLNAALSANPIGLVVVAIAALVAGIVLAWRNSETFRNIVTGAFNAVRAAATAVLNFFRNNWPIIATLISGPFAPIVLLATDAFGIRSKLIAAFTAILDWVKGNWKTIVVLISGPFAPLVALATDAFGIRSAMVRAFGAIKDAVTGAIEAIVDSIKTLATRGLQLFVGFARALAAPVGAIVDLFNGIWSVLASIRAMAVGALDKISELINMIPSIPSVGDLNPFRAAGGPVKSRMPYIVGEEGPELFVPGRSGTIVPNNMLGGTRAPGAAPSSGGGSPIILNFFGPTVGTGREFEDTVRRAIYDVKRRNPGAGI